MLFERHPTIKPRTDPFAGNTATGGHAGTDPQNSASPFPAVMKYGNRDAGMIQMRR
jgi:hypothetical protein